MRIGKTEIDYIHGDTMPVMRRLYAGDWHGHRERQSTNEERIKLIKNKLLEEVTP